MACNELHCFNTIKLVDANITLTDCPHIPQLLVSNYWFLLCLFCYHSTCIDLTMTKNIEVGFMQYLWLGAAAYQRYLHFIDVCVLLMKDEVWEYSSLHWLEMNILVDCGLVSVTECFSCDINLNWEYLINKITTKCVISVKEYGDALL